MSKRERDGGVRGRAEEALNVGAAGRGPAPTVTPLWLEHGGPVHRSARKPNTYIHTHAFFIFHFSSTPALKSVAQKERRWDMRLD